ncbi:MAG TPA: DUF805 domain-containing protein [Gammaproteobacteria bacterium]
MQTSNPYQTPSADVTAPLDSGYDQSNPFSPSGRFGRLSYMAWGMLLSLPIVVIAMLMGIGAAAMGAGDPSAMMPLVGVMQILQIIILIPMVIFAIRRLHDFDASGWWALLTIVPLANVIFALVLLLRRGTEGANRFAPPRITRGWEKGLGYLGIVFLILALVGIVAAIAIPAFVSH